jgi:hypothetical protein
MAQYCRIKHSGTDDMPDATRRVNIAKKSKLRVIDEPFAFGASMQ